MITDNIAAKEQAGAPEGIIAGLILNQQVKSRPIIYNGKIQGHIALAGGPIYQEVRNKTRVKGRGPMSVKGDDEHTQNGGRGGLRHGDGHGKTRRQAREGNEILYMGSEMGKS
eukprot:1403964-Pleurochrysis_carterae.AAC.2